MPKEKSSVELRQEHKDLRADSQSIIDKAHGEKRGLTPEETEKLNGNQLRMAEITLELESRSNQSVKPEHKPEERGFSFIKAIRATMEGTAQEEPESKMLARGAANPNIQETGQLHIPLCDSRSVIGAAAGKSAGAILDESMGMVLPLSQNLVLAQAGARILTGLRGDLKCPGLSAVTVLWDAENDAAADGGGSLSNALALSPKRLTAYVDISRQLLIQENENVEGYIRELIAQAVAEKLQATILGKAAAGDGPVGMFYTAPTLKGVMAWPKIVDMETAVSEAGGLKGNLTYILHSKLYGMAKTLPKTASGAGGLVLGNDGQNLLNGYKVLSTGNVANELNTSSTSTANTNGYGALFGNFADMIIGNWGNLDITVDNLTQATKGAVRLVLNSYWNYGVTRSGSFKTAALSLS